MMKDQNRPSHPSSDALERSFGMPERQRLAARATWLDMCDLAHHEPEAAIVKWYTLIGRGAAPSASPASAGFFDYPRYAALRKELSRIWEPQNSVERMFVDQLARAFTSYMYWLIAALGGDPANMASSVPRARRTDEAARMADITFLEVLRALKAMRELRQ